MSLLTAKLFIGGAPTISVGAGTYMPSGNVSGGYKLEADGDIMARTGATTVYVDNGDWCVPKSKALGSGYQVRATLNSGSLSTGTTGTWLALTSDREWTVGQYDTANLTIDIRNAGGTIVATGVVIVEGGSSAYSGDVEIVTVGQDDLSFPFFWGYDSGTYGSIADGSLNIYGPATDTVSSLYYGTISDVLSLTITSSSTITNTNWSTVNIAGTTFNRTDATYSGGGSSATWTWYSITTNPFGFVNGANKTVTFA